MNVELLVSLVSEHKELYFKFVWFWQVRKYLLSSSEWQASVRSVKLRSATLCTGVFLFYIKRHLMSGNEFACSLGSSSAKIAWMWTQKTRWKTLTNNARRYSSRCVRALRVKPVGWVFISSTLIALTLNFWQSDEKEDGGFWHRRDRWQLPQTFFLNDCSLWW